MTLRLTGALLFALGPAAAGTLPAIAGNTRYPTAREALVAAGWQPARLPDADGCAAFDARCRAFPEAHACAGTGPGNCLFTWRRGGTVTAVNTAGESPPVLRSVTCPEGFGR